MIITLLGKIKRDLIKEIEPNFILRRYDILFNDVYELIKITTAENTYYIPFLSESPKASLAVELQDLPQDVFEFLVKWVFQHYKKVKKISVSASLNYLKNSELKEHCEFVTILPETKEEYLSSLSGKFRYNHYTRNQTLLRRDFGGLEFKMYEDIPSELVQKYFELKNYTHNKSYDLTPEEYLKKYHVTEAYELLVGGETSAILFNSVVDSNVYVENITYDKKFSKYSVGVLLLIHMVLGSIDKGRRKVYWGAYNNYKRSLANKEYTVYSGNILRSGMTLIFSRLGKFILSTKRENNKKIISIMGIDLIKF